MSRVLVVCVGNICRSPMAVALLQRELADRSVVVESAGLAAMTGHPIHPLAAEVLAQHAMALEAHVASSVTNERVEHADLILAMERRHVSALLALYPKARKKIALFGKWEGDAEIADPYGRDIDAFSTAFDAIEAGARSWKERIR